MSAAELELAGTPVEGQRYGLEAWASEMLAAGEIARGVAPTPFTPKALRVFGRDGSLDRGATAANVAAALLAGRELGLEPMAALRSIHVIEGTPALSALAMRALVVAAGHELWIEESGSVRCIARGRRLGESRVHVSRWDMDRASRAGLAGKENWRKQPTAMLIARATSEVARLTAPEVLLGIPYSSEELLDADTLVEPERPKRRRTARREPLPEPAIEPAPVAVPPAAPASAQPVEPTRGAAERDAPEPTEPERATITAKERTAIHAALSALGITKRADRLRTLGDIIGHELESTNDLTPSEGKAVAAELADRKRFESEPDDTGEPDAAELADRAREAVVESQAEGYVDVPLEWPALPEIDEPPL